MRPFTSSLLCFICLAASGVAGAQAPAIRAEPTPANAPVSHFLYKLGAIKGNVLTVYVTSDFYDLYVWEKEAVIEPVFTAEHAKSATLTTIALRDAKTGKTVGTYLPKTGVSML